MVPETDKQPRSYWFDAVLHPHRSLGAHGFFVLMTLCCLAAFVLGLRFYVLGAWPVFAFLGLDVLALYIAFRINYRRARMVERVWLSDDALAVRRVMPNGTAREWRFQPAWVRIDWREPADWKTPLTVGCFGDRVDLGAFLTPEERGAFARALKDALRRQQAAAIAAM